MSPLMSLISPPYMAPHHAPLRTLNFQVISSCAKQSCNLSLCQGLQIPSAEALKAPPLSEIKVSGLVRLVIKAINLLKIHLQAMIWSIPSEQPAWRHK